MRDRFDHATYLSLLERASQARANRRFADLAAGPPPERFYILRHDIDYSPRAGLELAELEARRGYRASYFLLMHSRHCNLLEPRYAGLARRLVELGHEVGLHYEARFFLAFPPEQAERLLEAELALLSELAGERVVSIAMHQPGLNAEDPFRDHPRLINAYAPRFARDIAYISDSCRA